MNFERPVILYALVQNLITAVVSLQDYAASLSGAFAKDVPP